MELVAAGKVTKAFGKDGEVIALLYDNFPGKFDTREPLYILLDGLEVPFFISSLHKRGRKGARIVFDDIDNESRAGIIVGHEFLIPSDLAVAPAKDAGLGQFIGYTAIISEEGSGKQQTGIITGISGNENNPLFTVEIKDREVLIPAVEEMRGGEETAKRMLWLDIPPGLLDL